MNRPSGLAADPPPAAAPDPREWYQSVALCATPSHLPRGSARERLASSVMPLSSRAGAGCPDRRLRRAVRPVAGQAGLRGHERGGQQFDWREWFVAHAYYTDPANAPQIPGVRRWRCGTASDSDRAATARRYLGGAGRAGCANTGYVESGRASCSSGRRPSGNPPPRPSSPPPFWSTGAV